MKAKSILTGSATAAQSAVFMKGVAWACQFLRDANALNGSDTEHAKAMHRSGRPQAQLLPQLVAAMNSDPDLLPGANAILTEYLCCGGEDGAGVMSVEAYASKSFEDFMREDYPDDKPAARAATNVVALHQRAPGIQPGIQGKADSTERKMTNA